MKRLLAPLLFVLLTACGPAENEGDAGTTLLLPPPPTVSEQPAPPATDPAVSVTSSSLTLDSALPASGLNTADQATPDLPAPVQTTAVAARAPARQPASPAQPVKTATATTPAQSTPAPSSPAPADAIPAAPSPDLSAGRQTYQQACAYCHDKGVAGAPKPGDATAWSARTAQGMAALYTSALLGKGAMPAKGGNPSLSDAAVKAAVDYLIAGPR